MRGETNAGKGGDRERERKKEMTVKDKTQENVTRKSERQKTEWKKETKGLFLIKHYSHNYSERLVNTLTLLT